VKLEIALPQEIDWVTEELKVAMDRGLAEVSSGARPEYAAGYYQAAKDLTEALEGSYAAQLQARRGIREVKRDA